MDSLVKAKLPILARLCRRHRVRRLDLFGSAATGGRSREGDVDFVVEFHELTPVEHADAFFGLLDGLETTLGLPVDLLEARAVRNPYLRESIAAHRETIYAAA